MDYMAIYRSFKKDKKFQAIRVITLFTTIFALIYISHFNNPNNLLRKAYNKTALWIPYSQKMNYYNTGFIGGFLYNLKIDPMEKPKGYSEEKIKEITRLQNWQIYYFSNTIFLVYKNLK